MLPFLISFIVACLLPRNRTWWVAVTLSLVFAVLCSLTARGQYDDNFRKQDPIFYGYDSEHLTPAQENQLFTLVVLYAPGLGAAEVVGAFLLAYGIRLLIFRKRQRSDSTTGNERIAP
jgi:hypothetical protein